MTDTRKKLALICGTNIDIVGEGSELKVTLTAHRKKKSGSYDFYAIELDVDRYAVKRLAQQIATMHVRDRKRLENELARIEREVEAIKQPEQQP